jgi:hypothetical protein
MLPRLLLSLPLPLPPIKRPNIEPHIALPIVIGEAAFLDLLDKADDLGDVFGDARHGVWRKDIKGGHVGKEGGFPFGGEGAGDGGGG